MIVHEHWCRSVRRDQTAADCNCQSAPPPAGQGKADHAALTDGVFLRALMIWFEAKYPGKNDPESMKRVLAIAANADEKDALSARLEQARAAALEEAALVAWPQAVQDAIRRLKATAPQAAPQQGGESFWGAPEHERNRMLDRIAALEAALRDKEREGFILGATRVANHRPPSSYTHDGANTLNEIRAFCDAEVAALKGAADE